MTVTIDMARTAAPGSLLPLLAASAALPVSSLPDTHERGFSFKVPRSQRHAVARAMTGLGKVHGFEVERVGFLGRIRCTYRERDSVGVLAFLTTVMGGLAVTMIPDYQARYGVAED